MLRKAILPFLLLITSCLYAQPKLGLSKAYWEIGKVNQGTVIKEVLGLKNKGNKDLEITARPSCECTTLSFAKTTIRPGSQADLKITFDTSGFEGPKTEYIFIDSNDPVNAHVTWLIEADILALKQKQPFTIQQKAAPNTDHSRFTIEIYSTPNCTICKELKEKRIPAILNKHDINVNVKEFKLNIPENYERFVLLEDKFNDKGNKLPAVVVGNRILGGRKEINENLENQILLLVQKPDMTASHTTPADEQTIKQTIAERIESLKVLPILAAGLIDGFNPCAFAGIVFLVAYIGMVKKRAFSEVFWTGLMFITGIFVIYVLIGIGLSKIFTAINALKVASRIVYIGAGIVTLGLAYLSFADYFSLRAQEKGKKSKVVLQLPPWLKRKMHDFISKYANVKYLIPFGFILGVVVSFMEFFCTGQIYLPTIMYMTRLPELMVRALFYLSLYSLMFIMPLIIIFISLLISLKSGRLQALNRSHVKLVKILTGLLFLGLSIFMFLA